MKIYNHKGRKITPAKITHKHSGVIRQYEQLICGCSSEWAHVELPQRQWGTRETHELVFVEYMDPNGCATQYWAAWPKGWEAEVKAPEAEKPAKKLALEQINEDARRYAYSFKFTGRKTYRPIIERYESGGRMSGGGWRDFSYRGDETISPEYKKFLDEKIREYKASLPAKVLCSAETEYKAFKEAEAVRISREAEQKLQQKIEAEKTLATTPGTREYFDAWKKAMAEKFASHLIVYKRDPKPENRYYIVGFIKGTEITTENTPL